MPAKRSNPETKKKQSTPKRKISAKKTSSTSSSKRKVASSGAKKTATKKIQNRRKSGLPGTGLSTVPVPRKKKGHETPVDFFMRNVEKFEHSIDFNITRGILAGFLFMLIAESISLFGLWMNKFYYTHLAYAELWSEFITPVAGQFPWSFFLYSALVSFFVGFIYSFFYHMVRVSIHGHAPHKDWVKGLLYGVFLTFVVGIPSLLQNFLVLAVPDLLAVSWFAESVMTFLAGGVVIACIMK
ncbi:MAG: hypothetical protein ACLFNK_00935 [Candidatus Woesearchaeota archaeon]